MELCYKVVNKVFLAHENRKYLSSVSLSINTQIKCNALQYITDTGIMLPSFTFKDTFVPSKTLTVWRKKTNKSNGIQRVKHAVVPP